MVQIFKQALSYTYRTKLRIICSCNVECNTTFSFSPHAGVVAKSDERKKLDYLPHRTMPRACLLA